jgi:mRNA-degrading endonuclease YafQ of YafQ-DinJ toxin-antitoxin module
MLKPEFQKKFIRKEKKLFGKNHAIRNIVDKTIICLLKNPHNPVLRTHKTSTKASKEKVFSSRVTGDIRIIWKFSKEDKEVIEILDIGGHEGRDKVYK